MLNLYVDGDAFPNLLKPILLRSIERLSIKTYVLANKKIDLGRSEHIEYIIVETLADEADNKIVEMLKEGDLVITADIPLADRVISKNAHAIDHRGELYSVDNIKQYLAMRNLMESIRDSGEMTSGPKPFSQKDAQMFANQLNSFLIKHRKLL
ncbi:MAG: YaiI/YqxD family protein [Sulfurimonas sp.]|uniref:YaiI/YqxD family protein n=1 Tax=Sulfurimonas sp. TaxID=2022749 RepID=UPI0025E042B2|nr:YaiI/YqxD family protein [Sulfurimonas sp.]MCK9491609.1 YaiI/YqxD family protein [Sulfurimonas sp.]